MCGISGIYHPGQSPGRWDKSVREMTRGLVHRGPDEDGFYQAPGISLGMQRLKVIDLAGGTQPISNEDGNVQVVFNGEIYQYEALRTDLQRLGHRFKTLSDTEVLVHLYEQYGLNLFDHFDGMFAFALWDSRKQRLIVARDRFGIKPLFYTNQSTDGNFGFSSELRPLLQFPGLDKTLDFVALNQFFTLSYILHPRSIYQKIKKLSPGSFLLAENNKVQEVRYWHLPITEPVLSFEEGLERLDSAISSSVRAMMRSDVSIGAFLSGGLDSSTVVYHMAQHAKKPIQTFSVRFSERSFDEGDMAREISNHLGTEHYEISARPEDVVHLSSMMDHFGEPFADPAQIPTYLLAELAREHVTVALSGDGGDELLGGYRWYCASLLAAHIGRLPAVPTILSHLLRENTVPSSYQSHNSKAIKFLTGVFLPPVERHAFWISIFGPYLKHKLYSEQFRESLADETNRPVFQQWASLFNENSRDPLIPYQQLDIKTYLIDNNLTKVDRMSMAHSLEVRIPFLDLQVANTAFRLPLKARTSFLQTKTILRELMKGRLPGDVLKMRKKGFGVPLASWFRGPLKGFLRETLHADRIKNAGILRPEAVSELIEAHQTGKADLNRQIWNILCFTCWYENSEAKNLL